MEQSVWKKYPLEQREKYIQYLQMYGALSNLFRQKKGNPIPYLDSKFQETLFAKVFKGQNVDIGNTPHDIVSIIGKDRIGVGLKTWMYSTPSFQKVMQLKRYLKEINDSQVAGNEDLVVMLSKVKNERMISDYKRLGLSENQNIYHYITRDKGKFVINECLYPLIDINNIKIIECTETSITWCDSYKEYKFTFSDSQIWQKFDSQQKDTLLLEEFKVDIIEEPFELLLKIYKEFTLENMRIESEFEEIYLPLYSYSSKKVEKRSGLNAWNSSPKSKENPIPRPLNEVYIPIPKDFHNKYPNFFTRNILEVIKDRKRYKNKKDKRPEVRFHLILPNGKKIPALLTGDNMKNLQSGSMTERDENGELFGQSALGQWLLVDVLGLKERNLVTRQWLQKKGTDSVRIWKRKGDYSVFYIDFAPINAFEAFMNDEPIYEEE